MGDRFIIKAGESQRTDYYHVVDEQTGKVLYRQWAGDIKDLKAIVAMLNELNKAANENTPPTPLA